MRGAHNENGRATPFSAPTSLFARADKQIYRLLFPSAITVLNTSQETVCEAHASDALRMGSRQACSRADLSCDTVNAC